MALALGGAGAYGGAANFSGFGEVLGFSDKSESGKESSKESSSDSDDDEVCFGVICLFVFCWFGVVVLFLLNQQTSLTIVLFFFNLFLFHFFRARKFGPEEAEQISMRYFNAVLLLFTELPKWEDPKRLEKKC